MSSEAVNGPILLTAQDLGKLRLVLSTYQDGTGMLATSKGRTLPGWRDFERAAAAVFAGESQESKYVFDVVISHPNQTGMKYGISCKMRRELNRVIKGDGRITMELSNSSKKFWDYLGKKGISKSDYKHIPNEMGIGLVELVNSWHQAESMDISGKIDLNKSFYLVLSWSKKGQYQLHQFPLALPDPHTLNWHFPTANRLCGDDNEGTIFEWYGESGGQLKYYPLAHSAIWSSGIFQLEQLPPEEEIQYGVLARTRKYFPKQWAEACEADV